MSVLKPLCQGIAKPNMMHDIEWCKIPWIISVWTSQRSRPRHKLWAFGDEKSDQVWGMYRGYQIQEYTTAQIIEWSQNTFDFERQQRVDGRTFAQFCLPNVQKKAIILNKTEKMIEPSLPNVDPLQNCYLARVTVWIIGKLFSLPGSFLWLVNHPTDHSTQIIQISHAYFKGFHHP